MTEPVPGTLINVKSPAEKVVFSSVFVRLEESINGVRDA